MRPLPASRLAVLAAILAAAVASARAEEIACDSDKAKHLANARKVLQSLDQYLAVGDLTQQLLPEEGEKTPLELFVEAAPDTCEERLKQWTGIEEVLDGGPGDSEGRELKRELVLTRASKVHPLELYVLLQAEQARRAVAKCKDKKAPKKGKNDLCRDRVAGFFSSMTPPPPPQVTDQGTWTTATATWKDWKWPCLVYTVGSLQPVEIVPDVWSEHDPPAAGLLPALRWEQLYQVQGRSDLVVCQAVSSNSGRASAGGVDPGRINEKIGTVVLPEP